MTKILNDFNNNSVDQLQPTKTWQQKNVAIFVTFNVEFGIKVTQVSKYQKNNHSSNNTNTFCFSVLETSVVVIHDINMNQTGWSSNLDAFPQEIILKGWIQCLSTREIVLNSTKIKFSRIDLEYHYAE